MGLVVPGMVLKAVVLYTDLGTAVEIYAFVHAKVVVRKEVEGIGVQKVASPVHRANPGVPPKAFLVVEGEP